MSRDIVKIVMLLTAEYATVESGSGKLNILGVYNRFKPDSTAESPNRVYLVTRIRGIQADKPLNSSASRKDNRIQQIRHWLRCQGNFRYEYRLELLALTPNAISSWNLISWSLDRRANVDSFSVDVDEGTVRASTVIRKS